MPTAAKKKSTKRPVQKPKARVTKPEQNPGKESYQSELAHAWYSLGHWEQYQEQTLNETTALTYSAVWACVRLIAQTVACLGWHIFERSENGRERLPVEDDIAWLLDMQASPEMSAFECRQVLVHDALLGGNGYAEIERNGRGDPVWMYRLCPERVHPERTLSGRLVYRITNDGREDSYLFPEQIFHLRGLGADGLVGYSVIEMAKRTLKLGMDQERFGSSFFSKGPMPGGILKLPGNVKKEERDEAKKSFQKAYGGAKNAGNVITVSGGMEFTPLSLPNSDAQFLESRRFSVEEVCRWYGVPPHKIADLTRSTNNNIEHQAIEWVQDCLLPWCRRLETEANIKLFGRVNRGKRFTVLNLNTLLRGDNATQTETVTKKVNSGLMTVNEGRNFFDMNPIEDGDTPLIQGAMVRLDTIVDPPEPPPPVSIQPPTEEPKPTEDDSVEAKWQKAVDIVADTIGKLLRVETDKSERAAKAGGWKSWADKFYPIHEDYTSTHLREAFAAAIAVIGVNVSESSLNISAECAAQRHVARSLRELSCGPLAAGNWRMRATYQAKEELRYLAEEKLP